MSAFKIVMMILVGGDTDRGRAVGLLATKHQRSKKI
jgi:hypothetical protein